MPLVQWLFKTLAHRDAPRPFRNFSLLYLIWKVIRKYLCVSVIPFCPFNCLRILGYRIVGFKIGKKVFIGMQCYLDDVNPSRTIIEDNVTISYRVTFATHGPRMTNFMCVLRKGCYIGASATILGGSEIGTYATVGAGALVTKPVPAFCVAVGVPAKVVITGRPPWESQDQILEQLKKEADLNAEAAKAAEPAQASDQSPPKP